MLVEDHKTLTSPVIQPLNYLAIVWIVLLHLAHMSVLLADLGWLICTTYHIQLHSLNFHANQFYCCILVFMELLHCYYLLGT